MHKGYSDIQKENSTHVKTDDKIKVYYNRELKYVKVRYSNECGGIKRSFDKNLCLWSPVIYD